MVILIIGCGSIESIIIEKLLKDDTNYIVLIGKWTNHYLYNLVNEYIILENNDIDDYIDKYNPEVIFFFDDTFTTKKTQNIIGINHSKTRDYIFNYDNKNTPNTFYIDNSVPNDNYHGIFF